MLRCAASSVFSQGSAVLYFGYAVLWTRLGEEQDVVSSNTEGLGGFKFCPKLLDLWQNTIDILMT